MDIKHCFFLFVFILSCMAMNALGGETSTFKNPATQILQLQKGWNLCALTIAPDADSIALLNNHGVCWGWKNGRFRLLETFLPRQGFWMYSDENVQLTLSGEVASPASLHLGWNLVGADSDIQEKLSREGLHAWRYAQNSYQRIHDAFTPGLGYWIFKPSVIKPRISYTLVPTDGMWRIDGGDWNDSGSVATTEIGAHTISFQPINGYTTPADETVTLDEGEKLSKSVEYAIIPPTVSVTLNPATGKWRLDNGDWNDSSSVVTTEVGTHTISFQAVDGYTTPTNETVTLAAGERLSKTVDYEVIPPTVTVTLNPASGKWRIDDSDWNDSGSVVTTEVGTHTISFKAIDGYATPATRSIVLTAGENLSLTADYDEAPPTVTYTLNPTTGKWRMDNGEWYDSGTTLTTTAGSHRISFKAIDGYTTPGAQNIVLTAGQNLSRTVNYTAKQPSVTCTLSPTSGKWRLDGGEWNNSGATVTTEAGTHTISFKDIDGYTTPSGRTIALNMGDRLSLDVAYDAIPPTVTYTLDPPNGKWRIDEGDWNDSGATITTTTGSHSVSFIEIDGYLTPTSQNILLGAGRTISRTVAYEVIPATVCYTLSPATAKWRIDSGSWNDSGASVATTAGSHRISFQVLDGYTAPDARDITLTAGETFSSSATYAVIPPTVTYTLNPSSAKWRLDNGAWNDSGATATTTAGSHSITFQAVAKYTTPAKQTITLAAGENLNTLVTYEPVPPTVTYTLNPPSGKWRIDDGDWIYSGITVTTTVGEHVVSFMNMFGYIEPADQTIVLEAGETYTKSADYEKHDPLYVVVDLSSGPDSDHYPVHGTDTPPDLNDDTCRTTELWLRKIPAGTFMMGSPNGEKGRSSNETQHEVTLTQDYYIGVFECTQRQWELIMGSKPSYFNNLECYTTRPVERVSYNMIRGETSPDEGWPRYGHIVEDMSFMERLQTKTGLMFDLPSEAQWEYACRAGTTTALNSGNASSEYYLKEVARCGYNSGFQTGSSGLQNWTDAKGTAKVGSYLPNTWGLYDMHGNVGEWCLDWYSDHKETPMTDPVGSFSGSSRVVCGGSWKDSTGSCRSAYRISLSSSLSSDTYATGFRIAYLHNSSPIVSNILNISSGKWRLENDEWNDSKTSITTTAGEHVISYKDINMLGYINPPSQHMILEAGHVYKHINDYIQDENEYVVVDLSPGPDAVSYPVRWSNTPPDLDDDTCRTTELWLRRIKAGSFIMGSPEEEVGRGSNETLHKVILSQDYFIGVFECTQRQWELVMATNPSHFKKYEYYMTRPVDNVSFNKIRNNNIDSSSFIGKLQARTGLNFDLPTEAQWENACRAGTMTALNSGENLTSSTSDTKMAEVGRYKHNGGNNSINGSPDTGTAKVGSYLPNAWGLYDMHGNVMEWCLDYHTSDDYESGTAIDPNIYIFSAYSHRVFRGGSYNNDAGSCRSATRNLGSFYSDSAREYFGFRIVLLP